ncbi:MAG TPA: hypothetical protein GXX29_10745 [Firmicutes bacterium]|nr:hypothetical protein [Bacillota bacterium]
MTGDMTVPASPQGRIKRIIAFLFPVSAYKQSLVLLISLVIVIIGSFLGNALPVDNANLIAPIIVGYFFGGRIHPLIFMGAGATAACIAGITWSLAILSGDSWDITYALAIASTSFNVFVTMSLGDLARRAYLHLRRFREKGRDKANNS